MCLDPFTDTVTIPVPHPARRPLSLPRLRFLTSGGPSAPAPFFFEDLQVGRRGKVGEVLGTWVTATRDVFLTRRASGADRRERRGGREVRGSDTDRP